jgi:hypothetical protein
MKKECILARHSCSIVSAGILEQFMGARNRVEIGNRVSSLESIPGLLKSLKIPSQEKNTWNTWLCVAQLMDAHGEGGYVCTGTVMELLCLCAG